MLDKNLQEKKFPEITAQKAKIEKIKIRTWNSAKLIKSKTVVASTNDSYVQNFFVLKKHFHSGMTFVFHDPQS